MAGKGSLDGCSFAGAPGSGVNPDALLAQIVHLASVLDAAIESGHALEEDHVYALAGLVLELDRWMAMGRPPPTRWSRPCVPPAPLLVLRGSVASNEVVPSRRHAPARRRTRTPTGTQLSLPFQGW
jgi:hypothetical protein